MGPNRDPAMIQQLVSALKKLGRSPCVVEGFLTRPNESLARLGPSDDPMVGVFVHDGEVSMVGIARPRVAPPCRSVNKTGMARHERTWGRQDAETSGAVPR
jgi:hypothetical protein